MKRVSSRTNQMESITLLQAGSQIRQASLSIRLATLKTPRVTTHSSSQAYQEGTYLQIYRWTSKRITVKSWSTMETQYKTLQIKTSNKLIRDRIIWIKTKQRPLRIQMILEGSSGNKRKRMLVPPCNPQSLVRITITRIWNSWSAKNRPSTLWITRLRSNISTKIWLRIRTKGRTKGTIDSTVGLQASSLIRINQDISTKALLRGSSETNYQEASPIFGTGSTGRESKVPLATTNSTFLPSARATTRWSQSTSCMTVRITIVSKCWFARGSSLNHRRGREITRKLWTRLSLTIKGTRVKRAFATKARNLKTRRNNWTLPIRSHWVQWCRIFTTTWVAFKTLPYFQSNREATPQVKTLL